MSHHKPDPNKSVNLTIDGIPVTVPEGTTILEAAKKANVNIPSLCNYAGLGKRAVCRVCVVECDGRGKLVPACANEVWEGVSVVTNSFRLLNIRRTIIELLLNGHPPECLGCIKNKKCELQTLAAAYGIREAPFRRNAADRRMPVTENKILVRDMSKCIKCGRCVEVCQELQTARAINTSRRSVNYEICTPYGQALDGGTCIFCCQCAAVCPVGAIFGYDQSRDIETALHNNGLHIAAMIAPATVASMQGNSGFPPEKPGQSPGAITSGKLVTALKRMGFDQIFDAGLFAEIAINEQGQELLNRIKSRKSINGEGKLRSGLPMITGCSPALKRFIEKFYPDLGGCLPAGDGPGPVFRALLRKDYPRIKGIDAEKIISISAMPCIAKKMEARQTGDAVLPQTDFSLTPGELAGLIASSGMDLANLPETPFDEFPRDSIPGHVYEAYAGNAFPPPNFKDAGERPGIKETEVDLNGTKISAIYIDSPANARPVLDAVRKGECNADFIEINFCAMDCGCAKTGKGN